jgi:hypothetical protein
VRRRWSIGALVGVAAGVATLTAGFIGGLLGLVAIGLAVIEPPRATAIGGVLVGLGSAWLALFGRVALACRVDCIAPDLGPWIAISGVLAGLGVLVTTRALRAP